MLTAVPGVSTTNARKLVHRFGSLRAVANASVEDIRIVPGIGPTRSKSIHDAFTQSS